MSDGARSRGSRLVAATLLLCALGCLCIADATSRLERSNARRRVQLNELERQLARTDAPVGPLADCDGLFRRRIERVAAGDRTVLAFVAASGGSP